MDNKEKKKKLEETIMNIQNFLEMSSQFLEFPNIEVKFRFYEKDKVGLGTEFIIQLPRMEMGQERKKRMKMKLKKKIKPDIDWEFINELKFVLDKNFSIQEFNVNQLAKKLYVSPSTLYRKIQQFSGQSPNKFICSFRLKRALQLLINQEMSVTDLAFEVGFNSRTYFTKCFKEMFHQCPSHYILDSQKLDNRRTV